MKAPALPNNENERLGTLYRLNILDTPQEDRFDRYTRICQRLFDMPIALISLVDRYRQWFKSAQGLDALETPRDVSFCGHAILGEDVFEIRNARRDPRFRDNPLVTGGPHIRFYAGAPLVAPNGHRLGTLCLIDRVPRRLGARDKSALKDLAEMVSDEMVAYVDIESGALNRNGLRALGGKALDDLGHDAVAAQFLLFDVGQLLSADRREAPPTEKPVTVIFAEILRAQFPAFRLVAHIGAGNFCALLEPGRQQDREMLVARVSRAAEEILPLDPSEPIYAGCVFPGEARRQSIDEIIREIDALFYARTQTSH